MATAQDADARLLRALRAAGAVGIAAEALGAVAGIGPAETLGEIGALRAAGYGIETDGSENYRLLSAPDRLIAADIVAGLPAGVMIGREITVFEETGSTNDLAAQAGDGGLPEGLVILAESQRAGRGRLGRAWQSAPYVGLWFSVLLRPAAPAQRWPELTFCAALAVAEAAEGQTGRTATVKWPNDVLIAGRKISGILLECHHRCLPGYVVLGVGVNVLQTTEDFAPGLRVRASSLRLMATPAHPVSRRAAFVAVLTRLERHYRGWPENFSQVREACAARRRGKMTNDE